MELTTGNETLQLPSDGTRFRTGDGRLDLDQEALRYLEAFGALYWTTDDIARWFGITDMAWWSGEVNNPSSLISRTISKGELEKRAMIELNILKGAMKGDQADIASYREMMRTKGFVLSKLDIFGGSDETASWQKIQDYIATGSVGTLSVKEQKYIDLLNLVYSLDGQYGKRRTVKFLLSPPFNLTHVQASNVYAEAVELFHADRKVSKEAIKAKTADQLDSLYVAAVAAAKSTADYAMAAEILAKKTKLLRLDEEEVEKLSPKTYERMPTVLSLNPEDIGLQKADRRKLAELIDRMDIPQTDKRRLEMDAGIRDVDIVKIMDDEVQEAGQDG